MRLLCGQIVLHRVGSCFWLPVPVLCESLSSKRSAAAPSHWSQFAVHKSVTQSIQSITIAHLVGVVSVASVVLFPGLSLCVNAAASNLRATDGF